MLGELFEHKADFGLQKQIPLSSFYFATFLSIVIFSGGGESDFSHIWHFSVQASASLNAGCLVQPEQKKYLHNVAFSHEVEETFFFIKAVNRLSLLVV